MSKINEEWKHCYDELWKGRNIEINNLWQRSVFLLTLLLASFYVYFGLWKTEIDKKKCVLIIIKNPFFNYICINIAFFGLVFCYLWIRMGQGAKKEIEKYERSINELYEKSPPINKVRLNVYPHHGNLEEPQHIVEVRNFIDSFKSVFLTSATNYSVSRINIAIGQVVGVIWLEIIVFHIVSLFYFKLILILCYNIIFLIIFEIAILLLVCVLSYVFRIKETRYWIKSGARKTVEVKFCGIFDGNLKLSEIEDYFYIKYPRKRGYKNNIKIYTDKKGFRSDKIQIINESFYLSIIKDKDCSKKKGKEDQGNNPIDIIIKDPSGNVLTEEDLFGKKPKILDKDIKKIYIFEA